ncbi:MAG: hypothetical protein LBI10_02160 [Deltaproteobacteria bacterium]|jgi:hypothetical protein|nr:hypothetical protein [Deltaproteobacteria bacterium]
MFTIENFDKELSVFNYALSHIKEIKDNAYYRDHINRFIYTCQQSIGATLDALPTGKSNVARKK